MLEPHRLQIFEQAFLAAFATVSAFAIAAESDGGVEQVRGIHPHNSSLKLRCDVKGNVDALAPDASRQAVCRVISKLDRFAGRSESHRRQHRTENFLLRDDRRWMNIAEQGWRKEKSARWHFHLRLPAGRPVGHALVHQPLNAIKLHAGDDCADVDGFIERWSYTQRAHAVAYFYNQRLRNTFLHQQSRPGATHLPLIKPDSIHQAFDSAIKVGVLENNKRRFAAQLKR